MTRRIRTTRQAATARHKADVIMAKRRVDALRFEWTKADLRPLTEVLRADAWELSQAFLDKRAEMKRGES